MKLGRGPCQGSMPVPSFIHILFIIITTSCLHTPLTQLAHGLPTPLTDPAGEVGVSVTSTPTPDNQTQPNGTAETGVPTLGSSSTQNLPQPEGTVEAVVPTLGTEAPRIEKTTNQSEGDAFEFKGTSARTADGARAESGDSGTTLPPGLLSTSWSHVEESGTGGGFNISEGTLNDGKGEEEIPSDPRCLALCMINCTSNKGAWDECLMECNQTAGCIDCDTPCFNQSQTDSFPPHHPSVTVDLPLPGQVDLSWTSWEDDRLYILQARSTDSSTWSTVAMINGTSYSLHRIDTCGTVLRLAAVSKNGPSAFRKIYPSEVLVDTKTPAVVDVRHEAEETDDEVLLHLSWAPPPGWADSITSYMVQGSFIEPCYRGSTSHDHDLKYPVNNSSLTIRTPKDESGQTCSKWSIHGTADCLQTKTVTQLVQETYTIYSTILKEVKKRLDAADMNCSRSDELSPSNSSLLARRVFWTSATSMFSNVVSVTLYWGETTKSWLWSGKSVFKTPITVAVPANSTEYLLEGLKPETEYGFEIVLIYKTAEAVPGAWGIGTTPQMEFITGLLPVSELTTVKSSTTLIPSTLRTTTTRQAYLTFPYAPDDGGSSGLHKLTLYIVGPVALALFLGLMACCCMCVFHRQRHIAKTSLSRDEESIPNIYSSPSSPRLFNTSQVKPDVMDRWEISPARIKVGDVLGEGAFGQVLKGLVVGRIWSHQSSLSAIVPREATHGEHTVVAVKMLHKFAEDTQKQEFLREIELMKELGYHPNVVSLLGCCTITDPICLLVEHCYYGDLLHYLRNRRPQLFDQFKTGRAPRTPCKDSLRPIDLLSFARQIAMGMEYISQKGFVHRDLAARNVMVADDKNVKIGDFGLTRYVYDDKVYVNRRGGKLPVKWMSLEAIYDQVFTAKGDVWSYGVVLFEIMTLGAAPYPGISNKDMPKLLKGGYRMEKPENCSPEIFTIMQSCWFEDPEARPGFTSLRNKLEEMMEENVCYMEFDSEKQQCYYRYSSSSSSDDDSSTDGLDAVAEESPMLESSAETDLLLATPMLKIPSGGGPLQSRSTQNLSHASPRKRVSSVSLSMSSLGQSSSQSPQPEGVPNDSITFARNIDNHLYYAGHMTDAPGKTIPCRVSQEASERESNPYAGVIGSLENVQYRGIPIVAQLDLCCPHTENPQLCNASFERTRSGSSKSSDEGTPRDDRDSCLGEENTSEDDEIQCRREMRDAFGSSDLSQDGSQSHRYSPLVDFESGSNGSLLVSPMSMDSGVSCDLATSKLVFDVCHGGDTSAVRDTAL